MLGNYSKLIGSIVGSVVAIVATYLATKGLGTCVAAVAPATEQVCTVLGFTTAQITGAVVTLLSAAFVFIFPKNTP